MTDFPAAHSMDTDWFAVDADGNVGIFYSGENGAVPYEDIQVPGIEDIEDFLNKFSKDEKGIIYLDIESKTLVQEDILKPFPRSWFNDYFWLLLVLASEEVIPKLKSLDNLVLHFYGFPVVVYVDDCSKEVIESMLDAGEIIGGKEFRLEDNFRYLGLFYYCADSGMPTPYERKEIPTKPLKLQDLPEEWQKALSNSRFENIHFAETEKIQPIEHSKCFTWEDNDYWIDSQENERKGSENLIN